MKTLILALLVSSQAFAANGSGNVSSVALGGAYKNTASPALSLSLSDLAKRTMMTAGDDSIVASDYYALGRQDAGSVQVASGKNRYCVSMNFATSNDTPLQFGYATAPVSDRNASTPTGAVKFGGSSNVRTAFNLISVGNTAGLYDAMPVNIVFPQNSYPFVFLGAAAIGGGQFYLVLDCIEE